jgi:hypothetical protein
MPAAPTQPTITIQWPTMLPDPRVGLILANQTTILGLLRTINTGIVKMSGTVNALDTEIATLQADVTAQTGAVASATTLISGIAAQIAAAVAAATAAGATPAELASLTTLQQSIEANTASLAAAVAANNAPAAPAAPAA